jgi:hypothetical protein
MVQKMVGGGGGALDQDSNSMEMVLNQWIARWN